MEDLIPFIAVGTGVLALFVVILALQKIKQLSQSVERLSTQIPGTGMTAKELATELGGSIDTAFKNYVPKPEALAAALSGVVEAAAKKSGEETAKMVGLVQEAGQQQQAGITKLQKALEESAAALKEQHTTAVKQFSEQLQAATKALADNSSALKESYAAAAKSAADQLASVGKNSAEQLAAAQKSISEASSGLSKGITSASTSLQAVLSGHAQEVQNALQGATAQLTDQYAGVVDSFKAVLTEHGAALKAAGGGWKDQLAGVLQEHAAKMSEANGILIAQLEKISTLEKEIVKVLHVQETIEGTIKQVATSEEFKATLEDLRTHIRESDKLIREVAKPRTIRLVESDGELTQV